MKYSNKLINYILKNVNEIDIFSYYLKISAIDIQYCIEHKVKINNPLRIDEHPSLGFKYVFTNHGIKLKGLDFANNYYSGDFIDFVGFTLGKHSNNKHEFIEILQHIITHLIEIEDRPKFKESIVKVNEFNIINCNIRKWLYVDYEYWLQFKVPISHIQKYVFPVLDITINSNMIYYFTQKDPAYCFKETIINNKKISKVYFPKREKKDTRGRFITNNNVIPFDAIAHLRFKGTLLIIKSFKDYVLLMYILSELEIYDIDVVPITSETIVFNDYFIKNILNKYDVVFTLLDFDWQGVVTSNKLRKSINAIPLFFTNGRFNTLQFSGKDLAEVLTNSEYDNVLSIITSVYDKYRT